MAYHAALLGAESWLISAVGEDDLGRAAVSALHRAGVETTSIAVDRGAPTGRVRITFEDGEPSFVIEEGVAWDRIEATPAGRGALRDADVICFSTLAQRTPLMRSRLRALLSELRNDTSASIWGGAGGRRPLCLLDLNLRPPFTEEDAILEALRHADVVKLNEAEAKWLSALCGTRDAVRWLLDSFDIQAVALTRGAKGATAFGHSVTCHSNGLPTHGGDPVGAGDAFVAGFAHALCLGSSPMATLEAANRHGAWVAGQRGAMPSR